MWQFFLLKSNPLGSSPRWTYLAYMIHPQQQRARSRHGFSLVEVALALGVVSISLVSLVGILPVGLRSLTDSTDQTNHTLIIQSIAADSRSSEFSMLTGRQLVFDQEGEQLSDPGDRNARYVATVEELSPSLPGVDDQTDVKQMQSHLKRLRIGIKRSNASGGETAWYALQIAVR